MTDPHEWPRAYAAVGLRVFPIPHASKVPVLPQWQLSATAHPDAIPALWARGLNTDKRPDMWRPGQPYNIGLAPDQLPDGRWLWVIDIDAESHGVDGLALWLELVATHGDGVTPETWTAATGGGGTHLCFASPVEQRNGFLRDVDRAAIQTRGHGGYIVVAPSAPDGTGTRAYTWLEGQAPWDRPIADAPPWLLDLAATGARTRDDPETDSRSGSFAASQQVNNLPDNAPPGMIFAAAVSWPDLMQREGWQLHHSDSDGTDYWTRPGKERRDGHSATTNYGGGDTLKVFTSSVPGLQPEATYTKIGFYAALHHGGDVSQAATALRSQGFHAPRAPDSFAGLTTGPPRLAEQPSAAVQGIAGTVGPGQGAEPWPEPQPLPTSPPAPPWPRDVLPGWAQAMVDNVTKQVHCAPDLPGMFILGALSAASLGHIEVKARAGHVEPTTMYLVVAAPPSEGKSAALEMVFGPLSTLEEQWVEWAKKDVAKAQARKSIEERRAKQLAESAATQDGDQARIDKAMRAREQADAVVIPPSGRLMIGDITPEQVAVLMAENGERLAMVSDESGVLEFNRYGQAGKGSNLDLYLQAWSGRKVTVDRVTAPSVRLKRPLLTVCIGAQPAAWQKALDNQEFRDRGLGARFMSATPDPRGHGRDVDLDRDDWDDAAADVYERTFTGLAAAWHRVNGIQTVALSRPAKRCYTTWAQGLQSQMGPGGLLADEASWVNKMRDTVIRAAALLHLADGHPASEDVGEPVMARSCALGDYWIGHRLHHRGDEFEDARDLLAAVARLAHDAGDGVVTERMIARSGPSRLRRIEAHAPVIALLAQMGWLRIETALPPKIATDYVGLLKSMKGLTVSPSALLWLEPGPNGSATPATNRDKSTRSVTALHGESDFVAERSMSRIGAISGDLSTENGTYPQKSSIEAPNGSKPATTIDGEWSLLDSTTESAIEPGEVEPWSLLD